MFFVWSNAGGPANIVGFGLFLVQLLPLLTSGRHHVFDFLSHQLLGLVLLGMVMAYCWVTESWRDLLRSAASSGGLFMMLPVGALLLPRTAGTDLLCTVIMALCVFLRARSQFRGWRRRDDTKERRISEIVAVVQSMPIEEFLPEEKMSADCSVSKLKQMMETRGKSLGKGCLERQDLVRSVMECRKYSDTCCICYEEFREGDLLRVLPECHHEFHVECLDQWAYTFASRAKRKRDPSCPLCKTPLKR